MFVSCQECASAMVKARTTNNGFGFREWLEGSASGSIEAFREAIKKTPLSQQVQTEVAKFVKPGTKYAVRSSGNVEDGSDGAFAGQFDTFLNVSGAQAVEEAILKCWLSMLQDHLKPALVEGLSDTLPSMGVLIMEQLDSQVSGVLFQANPISRSRSTYVVNATYGQGEGVVGGTLPVDTYYINAKSLKVVKSIIGDKTDKLVLDHANGGVKDGSVPKELQSVPALSETKLATLLACAERLKKRYNSPQDIEFSFIGDKLYVLQTRPITTLSERLTWAPPDLGLFQLNSHLTAPLSKFYAKSWISGMSTGTMVNSESYGIGFAGVDCCTINGFAYFCMRQPGPKAAPAALPPAFVLRTIMRLTAGKAIKQATNAWEGKIWNNFMDEWNGSLKAQHRADNIALQNVDMTSMSDTQMADHIERISTALTKAYHDHSQYSLHNLAPNGWFAIEAQRWTGCTVEEAFSCMEGYSPATLGFHGEFPDLFLALAQSPEGTKVVNDTSLSAQQTVDALKALKGSLGDLVAYFLDTVQYRLVDGYDCVNGTMLENPEVLVMGIRGGLEKVQSGTMGQEKVAADEMAAALRRRVPPEKRSLFDDYLLDARNTAGLRDERALYTDLTVSGIAHHAILEAGRRLVAKSSSLKDASLALDCSDEELVGLLRNFRDNESLWAELEERRHWRTTASMDDAPAFLGGVKLTPGREHFPNEYLARTALCVILAIDSIFEVPDFEADGDINDDPNVVTGVGVSSGVVRGPVVKVESAEDAARLKPGDIVLSKYSSSVINLVLGTASGIITELGGILCHAAICARETKTPAVVGCSGAIRRIQEGDIVELDGKTGLVTIIRD